MIPIREPAELHCSSHGVVATSEGYRAVQKPCNKGTARTLGKRARHRFQESLA